MNETKRQYPLALSKSQDHDTKLYIFKTQSRFILYLYVESADTVIYGWQKAINENLLVLKSGNPKYNRNCSFQSSQCLKGAM